MKLSHTNRSFRTYIWLGVLIVSILGTGLHFLYEWSGNNRLFGFISPVNESTWEHMKLLYFPMLLYVFLGYLWFHGEISAFLEAGSLGIITGLCLIPTLFYTYTGILGFHTTFLDIAIYYISVILSFWVFKESASRSPSKIRCLFRIGVILLFGYLFVIFTDSPPDFGIFMVP